MNLDCSDNEARMTSNFHCDVIDSCDVSKLALHVRETISWLIIA